MSSLLGQGRSLGLQVVLRQENKLANSKKTQKNVALKEDSGNYGSARLPQGIG